jgi:arsenical pump membrane protein
MGFLLSSPLGLAPAWIAVAGAAAISLPALARRRTTPLKLAKAAEPGFLVFVVGLSVIVRAAVAVEILGDDALAECPSARLACDV